LTRSSSETFITDFLLFDKSEKKHKNKADDTYGRLDMLTHILLLWLMAKNRQIIN